MTPALDISEYQGAWQDRGDPIVMIKMSGGDDGLYMDPDASANYAGAVAGGRAVGGYHFAGWTNPSAEATYFMQAMSPVAENDVYALDAEAIPANLDPVAWSLTFMQTVHNAIGVWPLIYMNLSTLNSYNWDRVLANCGLWLADWAVSPSQNIPTLHTYVMQQYSDGPVYDHDEWFGTVAQFQAYGYHAANAQPISQPAPAPAEPPAPAPEPTPQPVPVVTPAPAPSTGTNIDGVIPAAPVQPPVVVTGPAPTESFGDKLAYYYKGIVAFLTVGVAWLSTIPQGMSKYAQLLIGALGALGVVAVPNKKKES